MMRKPGPITRAGALAAILLAQGSAIAAAREQRIVGDWIVRSEADRFGDGGTYVAVTASAGLFLAVRCIRKQWSLALMEMPLSTAGLKPGSIFSFKMRVDRRDIAETSGVALNERVIALDTSMPMIKELMSGREIALRVTNPQGAMIDVVFSLAQIARATAEHRKECSLY